MQGVNTDVSDTEYIYWGGTETSGWTLSGIGRVDNFQWVIFRWIANGSSMQLQMSKDHDESFQTAGVVTGRATTIRQFSPELRGGRRTSGGSRFTGLLMRYQ